MRFSVVDQSFRQVLRDRLVEEGLRLANGVKVDQKHSSSFHHSIVANVPPTMEPM